MHPDLLAHYDWVRDRARRLAGDACDADDLAQETFLRALLRPPARGHLRGWLGVVLRNVLRQDLRGTARRVARERAAARAAIAEEDREHDVVRGLLRETMAELEEPFRTALTLRYYEGLAISEIAGRTGAPIDTVRSRLRRGLARMRRRLALRLSGSERRFLAALITPFVQRGEAAQAAGTAGAGVALLSAKWKLALGAALVATGALVVPRLVSPGGPHARTTGVPAGERERPVDAIPAVPITEPRPAPDQEESSRVALAPAETPGGDVAPAAVVERTGWVIDAESNPVAGVGVALLLRSGGSSRLESSSDGSLAIEIERGASGRVQSADERFATILAGELDPDSELEPVLVVAPAVLVGGTVVDPGGIPLSGASVAITLPSGFQRRFERVLDASVEREHRARTDAQGRFALGPVPAVEGARLAVAKAGFENFTRPAPLAPAEDLRIELTPLVAALGDLQGRVVDPEGRPVAEARVAAAGELVRTDAEGVFVFPSEVRSRASEIVAVRAGHLPARARAGEGADGPLWPDHVELRLGGIPLEIHGRVVDGEGGGLPGIRVWIDDPTHFAVEGGSPAQVEGLLAGNPPPSAVEASGRSLRGTASTFWSWDTTDSAGRFRLRGLLERPYRVKAMDVTSLLHALATGVPAGTRGVEITLEIDQGLRYAGVVRSAVPAREQAGGGAGVPGVNVQAFHRAYRIEYGEMSTVWDSSGPSTWTDEAGRFSLENLPEGVWLYASGEGIASKAFFLDPDDPIEALELEVELTDTESAHFRVELAESSRADRFALLDSDGSPKEVALVRGGSRVTTTDPELVDGVSYVYTVREGAYELVLYRGDAEVARLPVTLVPGEVNLLRP